MTSVKIKKILKNKYLYIILQFFFSFVFLAPYFTKGKQILYGEASYYLDWGLWLNKIGNTWMNIDMGRPGVQGIGNHFPILYIWSFLEKVGLAFNHIQFIWFFLLLFLPFLFVYLIFVDLIKLSPIRAFLLSSIFIYTPSFYVQWLNVNPWLMAVNYVMPLFFYIIGKFWESDAKTFVYFSIASFFSIYLFANPPMTVIAYSSVPFAILFFTLWYHNAVFTKRNLKKIALLLLSILLINNFVISTIVFNFQYSYNRYINTVNPTEIFKANSFNVTLDKVFQLRQLISTEERYNNFSFFNSFFNAKYLIFVLYFPIIFIVILFFKKRKPKDTAVVACLLLILLFLFFLIKRINEPFGQVLPWMFENIPMVNMFKSISEKFSPLVIFTVCLLMGTLFKNHKKNIFSVVLLLYVIIMAYPFYSGNLIPDTHYLGTNLVHSAKVPSEVEKTITYLNQQSSNYSIITLPSILNYLVLYKLNNEDSYLGLELISNNINKGNARMSDRSIREAFYDNLENGNLFKLLSLLNIKYVIVNENIKSGFGFYQDIDSPQIEENLLKRNFILEKNIDGVKLYCNSTSNFLQKFYATNLMENLDLQSLSNVLLSDVAVPFAEPKLEFRKINPTKYVVRVHRASDNFSLIFSENFDEDWKLYLTDHADSDAQQNLSLLNYYKISEADNKDQADPEELRVFINNGWLSTLGNGEDNQNIRRDFSGAGGEEFYNNEDYKINFISKNFQGTIQNDNLPKGRFYETWMAYPLDNDGKTSIDRLIPYNKGAAQLPDEKHLIANSYANAWRVDINEIKRTGKYIENADGSIDFELIVEFWPQRLFYIGLLISLTTLLGSLAYLGYDWRKKHKLNNNKINYE